MFLLYHNLEPSPLEPSYSVLSLSPHLFDSYTLFEKISIIFSFLQVLGVLFEPPFNVLILVSFFTIGLLIFINDC